MEEYVYSNLEDDELLKYKKLLKTKNRSLTKKEKEYYEKNPIYISLTTSPIRLRKIITMLSIILQFPYIKEVHINLPKLYRNKDSYNIEDINFIKNFDKKIKIYRVSKDEGPLTKILPTIQRLKRKKINNVILSVDDDIGYPHSLLYEMAHYCYVYPKYIFTGSGFEVYKEFSYYKLGEETYWPKEIIGKKIKGCEQIEVVEGFGMIAYRPNLFDIKLVKTFNKISKDCKLSDDLTISFMFALNNVPKYVIKNKLFKNKMLFPFHYGELADALHKGSGLDISVANANLIKYIACMKHLYEKGY